MYAKGVDMSFPFFYLSQKQTNRQANNSQLTSILTDKKGQSLNNKETKKKMKLTINK
jgi:hypothetical protein